MLFKNLSWQEFLLAASVFSLVWYAGVWLMYFRKRKGLTEVPLSHSWQDQVDVLEDDLMGKPAAEPGIRMLEAEEFSFKTPGGEEQLGLLPDLQEEIKTACRDLESKLGKKADFLDVFRELFQRYQAPESSRGTLQEFIREHVPFFLSDEELEDLWG